MSDAPAPLQHPLLLCPICRQPLSAVGNACGAGHSYGVEHGVIALMKPSFSAHLGGFLAAFESYRAAIGRPILEPDAYRMLPGGPAGRGKLEWRLRRQDLRLVRRLLRGREGQRVLDVGAWNGWLSYRLTAAGHLVTAADYFVDEHDGLGALRYYPLRWRAVQCDLEDLEILGASYDVVILNRCLAFFVDPARTVRQAAGLLAPGGRLIATGLLIFSPVSGKAAQVRRYREEMALQGVGELKAMKGFLDEADLPGLRSAGLRLRSVPALWAANARARLDRRRPRHLYGLHDPR